ncbi:unnamed protein product [Pleuronectes platessa]|uniref:Uncharacterized protein n=1 Tax=Pleuronectes platessa TaxID=8262 RepID=A0A9N7Y666_PLEPL|nr:unnamed protein product [Pleuronectes platessa]
MDINSLLPIVTSYFEGMTSKQWNLSKAGKPDVATITTLGEKLLEIVFLVTQSTLKGHVSTAGPVSLNGVICSLGNTLPQIFAQALDVPDEVKLVSSDKLTRLIAKEIAECVNSVLSMSVDTVKESIPRITSSKRLQCLIQQAGKMIKGLMRNLKNQQLVDKEDCQASSSSRKTISGDRESLLSATSKTVQEIIKDEVSHFTKSSSDYEQLESGSTLEIKNVADDVAEVIVDEIMSQSEVDLESAQSSPSMKKMCGWIKKGAAKQFAQASICHIVERLNIKYFDSPDNPAFDKVLNSQGSGPESEVKTSEFEEEYSEVQEDGRKSLIRIIVMKLVRRIFDKAQVFVELRSPSTIIERLVEKIWIEIEDEDFEITPRTMKHIDQPWMDLLEINVPEALTERHFGRRSTSTPSLNQL